MEKDLFARFIELVTFDKSLLEYEDRLDALYEQLGSSQGKRKEAVSLRSLKEKELHAARLSLKEVEDELAFQIAEETKLHESHKEVHDKREYAAVKKEMEYSRGLQESLEKKILAQMQQVKNLEKELSLITEDKEEKVSSSTSVEQECQDKIAQLGQEFELKKDQRAALTVGVPSEWLTYYERIRKDVGNPVVAIVQDSCPMCFYNLVPHDVLRICYDPIICKGCFRILYQLPQAS